MKPRYSSVCECGDHGFLHMTRAGVALVDAGKLPDVAAFNWVTSKGYAVRSLYSRVNGEKVQDHARMHRSVIDCPDDCYVDHANHDRSDNRTRNLRVARPSESAANRRAWGRVKYKGVDFYACTGKYRARIQFAGKMRCIGYYQTAYEAAQAYDAEAVKIHGKFAKTNASLGLFLTAAPLSPQPARHAPAYAVRQANSLGASASGAFIPAGAA